MKFNLSASIALSSTIYSPLLITAFSNSKLSPPSLIRTHRSIALPTLAVAETEDNLSSEETTELNYYAVNKLPFRELQRQCKERGLAATGSTGALRSRLIDALGIVECSVDSKETDDVSHFYFVLVF